jgi:hypothetical protein
MLDQEVSNMTESGRLYLDNLDVRIAIEDAHFETMRVVQGRLVLTLDVGHVPGEVVRAIDLIEWECLKRAGKQRG